MREGNHRQGIMKSAVRGFENLSFGYLEGLRITIHYTSRKEVTTNMRPQKMKIDMERILNRIALDNGTTPEQVYAEMQEAIDAGYANPDPSVRAAWESIEFEGEKPTPEDLIRYAAAVVKSNRSKKRNRAIM